jgi:hypothetical protein
MHHETSTAATSVPASEGDILLTSEQMDQLTESLRARGETWTLGRIEDARKDKEPMTVNQILNAFGDPAINENKAVNLLRTIVWVITPRL